MRNGYDVPLVDIDRNKKFHYSEKFSSICNTVQLIKFN